MLDLTQGTKYDDLDFGAFEKVCRDCKNCVLSEGRTQVVVGTGPVPCNLMIVGEGPGEQEDLEGKPFVGRSGQLLTKILESVGIDRDKEAYIANVVKCRPPGNRTPQLSEIEACKPYLIRQIQLVQPRVLVVVGSPSLKTILEESTAISRVRGKWYQMPVGYMDEPLYVMPIFHPSYLLRNARRDEGSPKWLTWQDMKEVRMALDYYST